MVKPEWGLKRKCLKCGASFYDMRKESFACPKCGKKYSSTSYEEARNKQLAKLAKKSAPNLDDENLDEEALLRMTEDIPLTEEGIDDDGLDILEDTEDIDTGSTPGHNLEGLDDEENNEQ